MHTSLCHVIVPTYLLLFRSHAMQPITTSNGIQDGRSDRYSWSIQVSKSISYFFSGPLLEVQGSPAWNALSPLSAGGGKLPMCPCSSYPIFWYTLAERLSCHSSQCYPRRQPFSWAYHSERWQSNRWKWCFLQRIPIGKPHVIENSHPS